MASPGKSRIGLAVTLFFLSPFIAEFLLGNLPIKLLPALIVLAPFYGGGALLIREVTRRTGRGWPAIIMLGLVYGIIEEAFTTQSLFNPNYLRLNLHLLDPAYLPVFGIGAWWTLFVLNLHAGWSVATSIALAEALAPETAGTPWLGRGGLAVTAVLFIVGAIASTLIGYRQDHFLSSTAQLASAAVICLVLSFLAFRLPRKRHLNTARTAPNPWIAAGLTLAAGSCILLVPKAWNWGAVLAIAALDLLVASAIWFWSRSPQWGMRHKLALAAGAALAYAWHAFIETPAVGAMDPSVRIGNTVFALIAAGLIALAAKRTRAAG